MKIVCNGISMAGKKLYEATEIEIVEQGITLITGKNGVGKSTLLEQLYMQNRNTSILVSQHNNEVFSEIPVIENITMNQNNYSKEEIDEILVESGIEDLALHNSKTLCGGEKRVLSILRAICSDAEIIFLDEPTSDLDYRVVEKIIQLFNINKKNKSFVIVTHDDRLFDSADCIYEIENETIFAKKKTVEEKQSKEWKERKIIRQKDFCNKIFQFNCVNLILLICVTFYAIWLINNMGHTVYQEFEQVKPGQINICNSLYKAPNQLIKEGYIPVSLISLFNSNESILKNSKKAGKVLSSLDEQSYSLGLEITPTSDYDVYNLIYYDVKQDRYISILEEFGKDKIRTKDDYQSILGQINASNEGRKLEPIYCVVMLNNISFYDFVQKKEIKELFEANYYIQSSETIEIIKSVYIYLENKENAKRLVLGMGIYVLFDIIYLYVILLVSRNKLCGIRNYGFSHEETVKYIRKRYNSKYILLGSICVVSGFNIITYLEENRWKVFMNNEIALIYIAITLTCYILKRLLLNHYIKKEFNFGGKFNDCANFDKE